MEPRKLKELIDSLEPTDRVFNAVSFLLLVSKNNPTKTPDQILKRPDVKQAIKVIEDWSMSLVDAVNEALDETTVSLPGSAKVDILGPLDDAMDNLDEDIDLHHHLDWQKNSETEPDYYTTRTASIQTRINWIFDWVRRLLLWLLGEEKSWKVWVSRRAPNSCKVCIAMHGTTVRVYESFAKDLLKAGGKPYGGSFTASAHPRCQCRTGMISDAQAASGFIPSWETILG